MIAFLLTASLSWHASVPEQSGQTGANAHAAREVKESATRLLDKLNEP
jgi:hypothetical protein